MAERHRAGVAAVFTADPELQVGAGRPPLLDAHAYQLAHTFDVQRVERVVGQELVLEVLAHEATFDVVT